MRESPAPSGGAAPKPRNDSFLRAVVEASPDAVLVHDSAGRPVAWNGAFQTMLGIAADELAASTADALQVRLADLVDDSNGAATPLRQRGTAGDLDARLILPLKDGRIVERVARPLALPEGSGRPEGPGCIVWHRDLTDVARGRPAAELDCARTELALHAAKVGTWALELDGSERMILSSEGYRIVGVPPDGFAHTTGAYRELVHAEDRPAFDETRDAALRANRPYDLEYRINRPDGSCRWVRSIADVVQDGGRAVRLAGTLQDVTEHHALAAELGQAQKMEAIARLAGGVAHDFNNILTSITGHAELLGDELGNHPGVQEIIGASSSGARLTRQLLAFSRQQHLRPSVVDVRQIVRGIAGMLRRLIGPNFQLDVSLANALPQIKVDPGQLEEIIVNLVVNARDAMPNGGRVGLSAQLLRWHGDNAERATMPAGDYVSISVEDSGTGIPADMLPNVFEPFFSPRGTGVNGLGLATVYGIVKQSGGFLWVDSSLCRGTTFSVEFPIVHSALDEAGPAVESEAASGAARKMILVAEDQDSVRRIVVRFLYSEGHRVIEAASGAEAMRLVGGSSTPIDLLVTDVDMPQMSGPELSRRLRERWPTLRTVYISGFSNEHLETAPDALFVSKPFNRASLISKVREALSPQ